MLATTVAPTLLPRPDGPVRFRVADPRGRLLRLRRYWLERRGGRRWPRRADIDPVDIPDLLSCVVLLDLVGTPARFRHRLVGSDIVRREGRDTTGRWLEDCLEPDLREPVLGQYRDAAAAPEGLCHEIAFTGEDGLHYRGQRLLLPLSRDGRRVDMLFGGSVFEPARLPPIAARALREAERLRETQDRQVQEQPPAPLARGRAPAAPLRAGPGGAP